MMHDIASRFLPPSSRSFHGLYSEVLDLRNDVRVLGDEIWKLRTQNMDLQKRCSELNDSVRSMNVDLDTHDAHSKLLLWDAVRDDEEDVESAKRASSPVFLALKEIYVYCNEGIAGFCSSSIGSAKRLVFVIGLCSDRCLARCAMAGLFLGAMISMSE